MKIVFLHGLESFGKQKKEYLQANFDEVFAPIIDYRQENIWSELYQQIQEFQPDYLIGSSMGGYFAYLYAQHFNIPILVFNPALQGRSVNPIVNENGKYQSHSVVVLGKNDNIISPTLTKEKLQHHNHIEIYEEDIEHRIPQEIFIKYVNNIPS